MRNLSPPEDPCPPGLGGSGQKGEIFGRSPLPVPVSMGVPFLPLAREPEAGFLVAGLVGYSSEVSWWPRFVLAVMLFISFSSPEAAYSSSWVVGGKADLEFETFYSFLCSGVTWVDTGKVISFDCEAELVQGALFWLDFCFFISSSRFRREWIVWVSHHSSDVKMLGFFMLWVHWCGLVIIAYDFLTDWLQVLQLVVWFHKKIFCFEIFFKGFSFQFCIWDRFLCMRDDHHCNWHI